MKKIVKSLYTIVVTTVFFLLLLEIGLGVFYHYRYKTGIEKNSERTIKTGVYEGIDNETVKEIHRELRKQDMKWEPYLHYRFEPMDGKHNTIYANGLRKTENPSLKDATTAIKIFCFGGSTMYSSGARDEYTIPSELSKLIYKTFPSKNVAVTNFGCHGYTRASENIQLQRELVKGNIPDIVVFYDGVNEVISAHQNNEAGSPTNAYNRKKEFKIAHSYKKRILLLVYSSNLYRFVNALKLKLLTNSAHAKLSSRDDSLATPVAKNYLGLVKVSKSLEQTYGFKVYNFLQPHIYSKKNLTKAEKEYHKEQRYYKNLFDLSYKTITNDLMMKSDTTFVDISNVFNDINKTIYLDFCHTGELGNKLVAKAMAKEFFPYLETLK